MLAESDDLGDILDLAEAPKPPKPRKSRQLRAGGELTSPENLQRLREQAAQSASGRKRKRSGGKAGARKAQPRKRARVSFADEAAAEAPEPHERKRSPASRASDSESSESDSDEEEQSDSELAVLCEGTDSEEPVDYPTFIRPVAEAVAKGVVERGIVLGGSGNGEAMVSNRVKGVRCALCWSDETARWGREHNDANVLALGQRTVSIETALILVKIWLETPFAGGRHEQRIKMIDQ